MMPKAPAQMPNVRHNSNSGGLAMLQSFRNFFKSKLGVGVTLGFLGLIALAFASGDVASSGGFGSFGGNNAIATVGREKITTAQVERQINNFLTRLRQSDPTATLASFLDSGRLDELLGFLIDRKAAFKFGERNGLHIGDRLIDSEIAKIPRIQGPDGKVDPALYSRFLAERGMTDAEFRAELGEELMARQLTSSTNNGVNVPQKVTMRYAAMVTERRKGFIVTIPAAAFAPKTPPSEGEVTAWYNDHKAQYALPERRTIRYLVVGDAALKNVPAPTDAEITARYNTNKAKYAPTDKRKLSQMVLPTEAAAKQVLAELAGGKTLEASAGAKGLGVAALGTVTKDEYALQSSAATADAVFTAPKGKIVGPFKAPLGWLVVRVDGTEGTPGKTLDQARPELTKEVAEEKRRGAIAEFIARIEDELANGATLADVAKELGVDVTETPPLTADGSVYGQPGVTGPQAIAPIFQAAFAMESEKLAQVAEVDPGKTFMIFDVGKIEPAAPPPLAQIRDQVVTDVQLAKGAKAAEAAAKKVQKQLEQGVPVEVAVASLGVSLPPIDRVDKDRSSLRAQGQNVAKPELLLFAMAKGKVRLLAAPRNRGWYVVSPTEVIPGTIKPDDNRLPGLNQSLQGNMGSEYGEQLGAAMRSDIGATRNEGGVKELEKRLRGSK